jgi:hypothetical protein
VPALCGRFNIRTPMTVLVAKFPFDLGPLANQAFRPRFNLAPTQRTPALQGWLVRHRGKRLPAVNRCLSSRHKLPWQASGSCPENESSPGDDTARWGFLCDSLTRRAMATGIRLHKRPIDAGSRTGDGSRTS